VVGLLHRTGLRGWHLHVTSLGAVWLCIALWIRAKTVDQAERGNAERRALFVGLWPPTLWLIGDSLERHGGGAGPPEHRHAWSGLLQRSPAKRAKSVS
jgi:hypothetical protein